MDATILISALAIAVLTAIGFALAWDRQRRAAPPIDPEAMLERLVGVADRTFQAHVRTGKAQLEHQREIIDHKWDGVTLKMREELSDLRRQLAALQKERASQHEGFTQNLRSAAKQQDQLLRSTQRLNDILTNTQARGQWGERMADDVLRAAGMVEGVNYLKQKTTAAGTRPDFTFLLPDGQMLHMDAKFPLDGYTRYVEAGSELERQKALRDFGKAVLGHIRSLASRDTYLESATTVGYVLLFIPNDGVYAFIHEHYRNVFDEALETRVVICSPATLFAMLALVRQAMDTLAMERSSHEILERLSNFTDQWQRYVTQFDLVGLHLDRLNSAFGKLSSTRRNQLERQLDRIEELKNRTGPEALEDAIDPEPATRMPRLMVT
ncbi:MAG: DNA recombination protein RmuC [bacterium]|nr:DNA recombination protein RmuC [bacterium]MDE0289779.1 DNA recombination protein RmuC [bacterium]MDE0437342.1 DNA recombination protein RmuC [bacterium]